MAVIVTDQTTESIMLAIILILFYRQACRSSLSAIRFQQRLLD
jgi:hypothetical protein